MHGGIIINESLHIPRILLPLIWRTNPNNYFNIAPLSG